MALGDRIAVMDKGRIAQIGTPEEIYRSPANAFVADFIGTMNRIFGQVASGLLVFPGGSVPWTGPTPTAGLMFRPEDLKLAFFLGDHVRLVLDTGAKDFVIARIFERRNFTKGETLEFTLNPQTLVSLED
jgi:putative spermidine/putrescine transport system ATP-binding protein